MADEKRKYKPRKKRKEIEEIAAQHTPKKPQDATRDIVRLKVANPDLTHAEIGKIVGRDRSVVTRCLQRYNIEKERVSSYRKLRETILAGLQDKILSNITEENIADAGLKEKVLSASILYDKERLETNKSTQNIALSKSVEKLFRQFKDVTVE